ncbi:putative baseplate assembly protein [Aquabacterium sp.]|uniref:putative baseplate assembly protein n=1 Tax=Aquabacterium sp. TaxID=1872578 RepID=UPI001D41526D|nr:putative baseplate assembly protein [Aquabacterium sp.]MBT9609669.1 putative baseplate assembly protein [Aquabacterium sp.]
MPLQVPSIDDRRYADLVRDTLARVPVHTPEWTQLSESDPGVTLVELFAFLTESLLYRANRVPEVSRAKFLRLLGVPLAAVTPAQGLCVFSSNRVDGVVPTLAQATEVRAGAIAFRTAGAIDVLPLESRAFVKQRVQLSATDQAYYELLYKTVDPSANTPQLDSYETRELDGSRSVSLSGDTVDGALWIALLATPGTTAAQAAQALAGKTLSLGLVPDVDGQPRTLGTVGQGLVQGEPEALVSYALPKVGTPADGSAPTAQYSALQPARAADVLNGPGIVELPLPARAADIATWDNLDPLEAGVGDFPPALEDSAVAGRIVTWVRVTPSSSAGARMRWAGVNATLIDQRVAVRNELLGTGDGQPDQRYTLARSGVVPESAVVQVIDTAGPSTWTAVDDLLAAGPEVRVAGSQAGLGSRVTDPRPVDAYLIDPEAGTVRFGDGLRGRRPPQGARIIAQYDVCEGRAGNVPAGAIRSGPGLPGGVQVRNPLPTWGGADAEDVASGEKRVSAFVRHRDRLVTADDFAEIARRAPGVDIARVEVLAAYHPDLGLTQPGDAPGVVTLMLVPRHDPVQPDAPLPDRAFIDALCHHLDARRLITTELVLRGPQYLPIWLSVGITVAGGHTVPEVRDAVKARLRAVLAPSRTDGATDLPGLADGWPLGRAVNRLELMAEAARVPGVLRVNGLKLAQGDGSDVPEELPLRGLQLPRLLGLSVELGDAIPINNLLGQGSGDGSGQAHSGARGRVVPVPTVPREC